jgi:hypothetical protein
MAKSRSLARNPFRLSAPTANWNATWHPGASFRNSPNSDGAISAPTRSFPASRNERVDEAGSNRDGILRASCVTRRMVSILGSSA